MLCLWDWFHTSWKLVTDTAWREGGFAERMPLLVEPPVRFPEPVAAPIGLSSE